jgi:enoyl-CoA hydratase
MSIKAPEPSGLIVTIKDAGIAIVELNRPRKRNALSQALIDELTGALSQLDRSPTIFAMVLSSSGPFCGKSVKLGLMVSPD